MPQEIAPSGFFVLRTPLLPFDDLESWSDGLEAPAAAGGDLASLEQALAADRERLRTRLARLIERPEVGEALFLASPALVGGLAFWRRDPDGRKGRRAEGALVRYLIRMASRPTPFGLCAGCFTGEIGETTDLALEARSSYRRHTRLDIDYLFALSAALGRDSELRRSLLYLPNSSLYRAGGRLRYTEVRLAARLRSYRLVAVEATDYLERSLERARRGATLSELAQALVADDPEGEITRAEAEEFISELIDAQLLVSELAPAVTGGDPAQGLIETCRRHPRAAAVGELLQQTRAALASLDVAGLGADPETYRGLARDLAALPAPAELPALFQADLIKPAHGGLGREVTAELQRGLALLDRLPRAAPKQSLAHFCAAFRARYGEARRVPLVEALDEEMGIGFGIFQDPHTDVSPLLAGLELPPRAGTARQPNLPLWLLVRLRQALETGTPEIVLREAEIAEPGAEDPPPLPPAFHLMASVAAASPEALARGNFKVHLKGLAGPSGARLLGRLGHADDALCRHLERHLRSEEELDAGAIFAEIVHLPEGRPGNVLSRPQLRAYEIPFLGRGAADESHQIPITDLLVTVVEERIVLRSARLGRRVIPRLSGAHMHGGSNQVIYRFLGAVQDDGVRGGWSWDWGPLGRLPYLPRVSCGRLVLALARWQVTGAEIDKLSRGGDAWRFRAVQAWRAERRLPRRVVLDDGANELLVDLHNVLHLDAFLAVAKSVTRRRELVLLTEFFPGPEELCVRGPEGRFVQELVIPYTCRSRKEARLAEIEAGRPTATPRAIRRSFPPGSEWLDAKLYTGPASADLVLREMVAPLVREAMTEGMAQGWSFQRDGVPHWHLRLRFRGHARRLHGELLPLLQELVAPRLDEGLIWRLQLDTYEREIERYGGPAGVELAEQVAEIDSEAVLALVETLEGDEGSEARWRLALRGIAALLSDLGLEQQARLATLERLKSALERELRAGGAFRKQLAKRLRRHREELERLLATDPDEEHPLAPGLAILARRSRRLAPVVAELRARERAGLLTAPVAELAASFLRSFNHRLLRFEIPAHELVLYDFAHRLLKSRALRDDSTLAGGE